MTIEPGSRSCSSYSSGIEPDWPQVAAGRREEALAAYRMALGLDPLPAERVHVERRIRAVTA